jgi:hypothetical protein
MKIVTVQTSVYSVEQLAFVTVVLLDPVITLVISPLHAMKIRTQVNALALEEVPEEVCQMKMR